MFTVHLRWAAMTLSCTLVVACSSDPEPPHNAKYYGLYPEARAAMLKRCAVDQNTENPLGCIAAQDAELTAISGK